MERKAIKKGVCSIIILLSSCAFDSNEDFSSNNTTKDSLFSDDYPLDSSQLNLYENFDSISKEWAWSEGSKEIVQNSTIENFKFTEKCLFKEWGKLNDYTKKIEYFFRIDEKIFNWGDYKFYYEIKYDSIWIYSDSDILDGIDRGIIKKLTEDSLIIHWSTGDKDSYLVVR